MSDDVENPTPLAGTSRPSPVQAWEFMGVDTDEEDTYLRDLAGVDRLDDVSSLRLSVNTTATTISHLGAKLPRLQELNLTGSVIESIRDLGTGFQSLQVLWVSRCGLPGLDGLSALSCLRELYAAYNDIADLQPLDSCQLLEVLDMEGNCIDDTEALHALSAACPCLQSLTLAGNPVASSPDYHSQVTSLLRSLTMLDDQLLDRNAERQAAPAASSSSDGGAVQPGAEQDQELHLVREGIKHARVGVDSQEFRELEMTLLMAAELPIDGNGAPLPASAMLPASASSWLRCSQQGTLPSMQRARSQRSEDAASSRGSSRGGGGGGGSRPESSGAGVYPPASPPHLQRLSSGSARPPSARPGTASLLSNRPSTSAPPTAGAAGGLYWKKNRLSVARPHGSGGTGGSGAGPDDDDEDGVAAGSILTFGVSKGATMGASLARDLRRRKTAAATAAPLPVPPDPGPGNGGLARMPAASAPGAGGGMSVSRSYNCTSLLNELRRWKVETADRVLLPPEDEASGVAWPNAEDDERQDGALGERRTSSERASGGGRLPAWQECGVEGRAGEEGDEDTALPSGTRVGGAEVLSISASGAGAGGEPDDPIRPPGPALASISVQPRQGFACNPAAGGSLPPAPLSPSTGGWLGGSAVSSPSGKPPLAPLGPHRNGKLGAGQDAGVSTARGQLPSTASQSGLLSPAQQASAGAGVSGVAGPPSFPAQGLGPVHGHRPARPSKMLLCKVMFDTSGRVLLTNHHSRHSVNGAGQESLSIKSRPLGSVDPFQAHANPLFAADSAAADEVPGGDKRGVTLVSCCGEIDIRSVNPMPVQHIQDDGDSSADDLLVDL